MGLYPGISAETAIYRDYGSCNKGRSVTAKPLGYAEQIGGLPKGTHGGMTYNLVAPVGKAAVRLG